MINTRAPDGAKKASCQKEMLLVPSGASGNTFVVVFVFVIAAGCDATSASGNVSRSRERLRRTKSLQKTLNETLNNVDCGGV